MTASTGSGRAEGRRVSTPGDHGLTMQTVPRPATSMTLFGNDHALELEIGSGKGTFLVSEAKRRPGVNFLGVEYARRHWKYAADRLRRNQCDNARIVLAEAQTFARDCLGSGSLAAIHVYFPDPWPKTRHHKRRLFTSELVELLASKMAAGARLQVATDHQPYFDGIVRVLSNSSLVMAPFEPAEGAATTGELAGSNFERKYRREGRPFFSVAARKP